MLDQIWLPEVVSQPPPAHLHLREWEPNLLQLPKVQTNLCHGLHFDTLQQEEGSWKRSVWKRIRWLDAQHGTPYPTGQALLFPRCVGRGLLNVPRETQLHNMRWPKGTIDEIGRHFMGSSENRVPPKLLIYHHIPHEMAIVFPMFREPPMMPYGILLVGISSLRSSRCCWMKDFLAETPETSVWTARPRPTENDVQVVHDFPWCSSEIRWTDIRSGLGGVLYWISKRVSHSVIAK